MPRFNVQDPESGTTLTLEGDSPPSEQELTQIFAEHRQKTAIPQFLQQEPAPVPEAVKQDIPLPTIWEDINKPLVEVVPKPARATIEALSAIPSGIARHYLENQPDNAKPSPVAEWIAAGYPSEKFTSIATGVEHGVADLANYFTSPLGIATLGMGTLPKAAQRAISLAFALQMGKDVPAIAGEIGSELGKPENERDYQKISNLTVAALGQTGFAASAGKHGLTPERFTGAHQAEMRDAMLGSPDWDRVVNPAIKSWAATFLGAGKPHETEMVSTSQDVLEPHKPPTLLLRGEAAPPAPPPWPYVPPEPGPMQPITPVEERNQNAAIQGNVQPSDIIEHPGIAPRPDLQPDQTQVREVESQQAGSGDSTAPSGQVPPPQPGQPEIKPPSLTPALLVNGVPLTGGKSHDEIRSNLLAKAKTPDERDAINLAFVDDSQHVFLDENGQPLNRQAAGAKFDAMRGNPVGTTPKLESHMLEQQAKAPEESFEEHHARLEREEAELIARNMAKVPEGATVIRLRHPNGKEAIVSKDISEPGKWRLTWFTKEGEPWGHGVLNSRDEAIQDGLGIYGKSYGPPHVPPGYEVVEAQSPLTPTPKSGSIEPGIEATSGTSTVRTATEGEASPSRSTEEGGASEMTADLGSSPGRSVASIRSDLRNTKSELKNVVNQRKRLGRLGDDETVKRLQKKENKLRQKVSILNGELSVKEAEKAPSTAPITLKRGLTEEDGLLFRIANFGKIPVFMPDGDVVSQYKRLKKKADAGEVLTTDQRDDLRRLSELFPQNYEDDFGPGGQAMRAAFNAAKKAGIAGELFQVVKDGRNLRLDIHKQEYGFQNGTDLFNAIERLSNEHRDRVSGAAESREVAGAQREIEQQQAFRWDSQQNTATTDPLPLEELKEGTEFTLKGTKVKVAEIRYADEDQTVIDEVKLEDGARYGTQWADQKLLLELRMDKDSLKQPKGTDEETGWEVPPEEPQAPPPAAPAPEQPAMASVPARGGVEKGQALTGGSGGLADVQRIFGNLPPATPTQGPTGLWYFGGGVSPVVLRYERTDGTPLTVDDIKSIQQFGVSGNPKFQTRTWASEAEALQAQAELRGEAKAPTAKPAGPSVDLFGNPIEEKPPEKAQAAEGEEVLLVPHEPKKLTEVHGIVQEVIHNTEGEVGYHIFSPTPDDPHRVIRVWQRDYTVGKRSQDMLGLGEGAPPTEPAVQERSLTKAEQQEFRELSIKLRKQREENGPALTTEETQRYEHLGALAGQKSFGFRPGEVESIKGQIKALVSRLKTLQENRPVSRGKRAEQWRENYDRTAREIQELRDKLTEGQGEIVYTEPTLKELKNGYFRKREYRVRQLSDEEVRERFPTPEELLPIFQQYGERPFVSESKPIYFDDGLGMEPSSQKGVWRVDGYGKTRDAAIADARDGERNGWHQIPEDELRPKEVAPPEVPKAAEQVHEREGLLQQRSRLFGDIPGSLNDWIKTATREQVLEKMRLASEMLKGIEEEIALRKKLKEDEKPLFPLRYDVDGVRAFMEHALMTEARFAPEPPPAEVPPSPAPAPKAEKPAAPIGAESKGWRKGEDGRWRKIDEEDPTKVKGLPANKKVSQNLEEAATAPPAPVDERTPIQILRQAKTVEVTVPKGATAVRITDAGGRKNVQSLTAVNNTKQSPFQGVNVTKIEAGHIGRDGEFMPMEGEVKVRDTGRRSRSEDNPLAAVDDFGEKLKEAQAKISPENRADSHPLTKDSAINGKTGKQVLQNLFSGGMFDKRPVIRKIAEALLRFANDTPVHIISQEEVDKNLLTRGAVAYYSNGKPILRVGKGGFYYQQNNPRGIYLIEGRWNGKDTVGATATFLHEYIHSVTSDWIRDHPTHKLVQDLVKLAKESFNQYRYETPDDIPYGLSGVERRTYSLADAWARDEMPPETAADVQAESEMIHEFLAEALSKRRFQNFLAKQKAPEWAVKATTLWDAFVDIVRNILGLPKGTIMEETVRRGMALIEEAQKKPEAFTETVKPPEQLSLEWLMRATNENEPLPSLVKNPRDYENQKAFDEGLTALRTVAAWGDLARMKNRAAEELDISPRARRLLQLPNQVELYARGSAELGHITLENYAQIKDSVTGNSPNVQHNVFRDAWEAKHREDFYVAKRKQEFELQRAKIESPTFRQKVERLDQARLRVVMTEEKESTFRNVIGVKVANFIRQIEQSRGNDSRTEQLRWDLAQARQILGYTQAVAQYMDEIVSRVYRNYWQIGRASKNGQAFLNLFLAMRRNEGNPVTNNQELTLYRMASEVLAINDSLTEQLIWRETMRREPDFATAVNDLGRAFAERIQRDPTAAINELVRREGKLSSRAEAARRAYLSLQKQVLPELEKYSDLEQAVSVDQRVRNSDEWKALANRLLEDAGKDAFYVPEHIKAQVSKEQIIYGGGAGVVERIDPFNGTHKWELGYSPEASQAAQTSMKAYLQRINDWRFDPANANNPDQAYWTREHDIVDAIYNSLSVLDPSGVRSLGGFNPWSMPEFLFRQSTIPDVKVLQKYAENWHRAMMISQQWGRATEQPLISKIRQACDAHNADFKKRGIADKFDYINFGFQEWRERVLNPLAWEYRHDRLIQPGTKLYGVTILQEDIDALRAMGGAISKLMKTPKNIGAENIMETSKLIDDFTGKIWGVRLPQEFGADYGTTVPHSFSSRWRSLADQIKQIPVNDFNRVTNLLNQDPYFERFVLRWLGQRSSDFSRQTPFEDLFRQITAMGMEGNPNAPRSIEEILDYINRNVDEEYSPEDVRKIVVGGMEDELRRNYDAHLKQQSEADNAGIEIIMPSKKGPFTTGFERDIGSSFYYDFGMISAPEVLATGLESMQFHTMQFFRQLVRTEQALKDAMVEFKALEGAPQARAEFLKRKRAEFFSGKEFRDFESLQAQYSFVKSMRERLDIWTGANAAKYEGMQQLYRMMGSGVQLALSGWKTMTKPITAAIKVAHVTRSMRSTMLGSWASAAVSTAMSAVKIGLGGPSVIIGRRLGLLKKFEGDLSGWAEEMFRVGHFFNQQYDYGLGFKTPTLDTLFNNLAMPYSHGRGYDPKFSNVWLSRLAQKAFYRALSTVIETPGQAMGTVFPTLGYAIAYDAAARSMHWGLKRVEGQLRRSFDYLEKSGRLSEFNLNDPKDVRNHVLPEHALPPGVMPRNANNYNQFREFFNRGTDIDFQELAVHFWRKLSETPKDRRGEVHLLSADKTGTPEELAKFEAGRGGALGSIPLFDVHHAGPMNRPWAMRESATLRLMYPIAGWFIQSTRQIPALLGRAPYDRKLGAAMLTAMTAVGVLAWMGAAFVNGDLERRNMEMLTWLLEKKIDPVRHFGQGRDNVENAKIAVSDLTAYITILNSMFNMLLGEESNRGQFGAQVFVTEKINSALNYFSGVAHTHDITYGLPQFIGNQVPNTKIILSRLPGLEGLQNERNVKVAIQRYAPPELLRQKQGGFGIATPTELSPIKEKMANAIYRGDSIGVQEQFDAFVQKATALGRPDPLRLAQEVFRSLNPYALSLVGRPTDEQRSQILSRLSNHEREILLTGENQFLAAAQMLNINSEMVRQERGPAGQGARTAAASAGTASIPIYTGGGGGGGGSVRSAGGRISLGGGFRAGGTRLGGLGTRLGTSGASGGRMRLVRGRLRARSGGRIRRVGRARSVRTRIASNRPRRNRIYA